MTQERLLFISIIILSLGASHLLLYFTFKRLASLFYKPQSSKGERALRQLSQSLKWGLFFVIFPLAEPYFSPEDMDYLRSHPTFSVLFAINLTWIIIELSNVVRYHILDKFNFDKSDNLRERRMITQIDFIRKIFVIVVVVIASASILMQFESARNIGAGLLTSAGIAGIIIGFAAQKSIANLLAGFQIAFTQPIRLDDVVVLEGEWGKIEEINLTYVVVRIWDQRRLVLPITYFLEKPFQNWTRTTADIWGTVFLYVDHSIPVAPLKGHLKELLESTPLWDGKVQVLQVTDIRERTVELRCLMSAVDSPSAFDLRCFVREKMLEYIQQNYPESLPKTRILMERETTDRPTFEQP
ncbi:MAG: mechanosensitive ion channel [Lunatimonas sp.]|uniref:mechanosensitive ion channel family protein n=1 Tax=Lunatimonas sp. TaxID=2060141 RepID=UPI00263B215D|nr:mechanosensitive ion channel domain-containing protein [Lunatimonas sp.]MCC5938358.1 mechanosensitive ion channel [Lunatimonas sp.]